MSHGVTAHWWIQVCFRMLPLFTCIFFCLERRFSAHPCSQIALHSSPQCRTRMLDARNPCSPGPICPLSCPVAWWPFKAISSSCCVTLNHVWSRGSGSISVGFQSHWTRHCWEELPVPVWMLPYPSRAGIPQRPEVTWIQCHLPEGYCCKVVLRDAVTSQ